LHPNAWLHVRSPPPQVCDGARGEDLPGRPEAAVPALIGALGSPFPTLRRSAGQALRQIGKPAVPALCAALLHEPQEAVASRIARVLGETGDPRAVEALVMVLERPRRLAPLGFGGLIYDPGHQLRIEALDAVGRLAPEITPDVLVPLARYALDNEVRRRAREAMACIGEGNRQKTGSPDGKSLHKYLTQRLLQAYGQKVDHGFFKRYEAYLVASTPDSVKFHNPYEPPNLDSTQLAKMDSLKTADLSEDAASKVIEKRLLKGVRITESHVNELLVLSRHMGKQASRYFDTVAGLGEYKDIKAHRKGLMALKKMAPPNRYLRKALTDRLEGLLKQL